MVAFEQMKPTEQHTLILAILVYLLNERGQESDEHKLLAAYAFEHHDLCDHEGSLIECKNKRCMEAAQLLQKVPKKEVTITADALRLLKHYNFRCGSRLAGTVTAKLEEVPRVIL